MVVKSGSQRLSKSTVVFTSLGLALTAIYAAACSSAGNGAHGGTGAGSNNTTAGTSGMNPGGGISSTMGGSANASGNNPGGGMSTTGGGARRNT